MKNLIGLGALSLSLTALQAQEQKPNVIMILADDLGWADLSCNGSTYYETPNIDKLVESGVLFTNAHSASAVSSPARGAIMSGKFPVRTGYTGLIGQYNKPSKGRLIDAYHTNGLPEEEYVLTEAFRANGYKTMHFGKWHLGENDPNTMPANQGVDLYVTGFEGSTWKGQRWNEDGEFITDVLTTKALEAIDEAKDAPFLLNMWYYAVHTPIAGKPEDIQYFKDKAKSMGLDKIVDLEQNGDRNPALSWFRQSKGGEPPLLNRRVVQSNPTYAAFLYCLDQNVGRLVAHIEELGLSDNTIFIFYSDNGGLSSTEGSPTCNAPLREGKGWSFEGGVRVPLIISSSTIKNQGRESTLPVVGTDLYPTLLEMAGLPMLPEQHVDGESVVPILADKSMKRAPIYWHSPHYFNQGGYPYSAMYDGVNKYIYHYDEEVTYLFNLTDDLSESTNLAEKESKTTSKMKRQLDKFLDEVNALYPTENPNYNK